MQNVDDVTDLREISRANFAADEMVLREYPWLARAVAVLDINSVRHGARPRRETRDDLRRPPRRRRHRQQPRRGWLGTKAPLFGSSWENKNLFGTWTAEDVWKYLMLPSLSTTRLRRQRCSLLPPLFRRRHLADHVRRI